MRTFLLYGLSHERDVVHSEPFEAGSQEEARRRAHERTPDFEGVEVWEGAICLFRSRRKS